jgi:hypothetical protein
LRALGVERIVVTPLTKGWRIEGGADLQQIIAGGSEADVFSVGPNPGLQSPW